SGTGIIVTPEYVLTNYHVVEGCRSLNVGYPQTAPEPAYNAGQDEANDLMLLRTKLPARGIASLRLDPHLGEPVATYGFPLGYILAPEGIFTLGNIPATTGIGGASRHFQFSAPIQAGNSGGPVMDSAGNLIGMTVATLDASKMLAAVGTVPQNVNFAI